MSSLASEKPPAGPPAGAAPRSAAPARRRESLNLARRPFLNSRPVVRAALALWLLGLLLLLGNVSLFWSYLSGSADKRAEIAEGDASIARRQEEIRHLEGRLASFDLARQNTQIDFLNQKIAERTFSWSLLFDRVTDLLPNDVRLKRLAPTTGARSEAERRRAARGDVPEDGRVSLTVLGESRNDEALLQFVDNLLAHPSFGEANLTRESRDEEGDLVQFEITVSYIPGSPPHPAVATGEAPVVVEEETPAGPAPTPPPAPGGAPQ
jgi:Tfp pilus assembly protein PilN